MNLPSKHKHRSQHDDARLSEDEHRLLEDEHCQRDDKRRPAQHETCLLARVSCVRSSKQGLRGYCHGMSDVRQRMPADEHRPSDHKHRTVPVRGVQELDAYEESQAKEQRARRAAARARAGALSAR